MKKKIAVLDLKCGQMALGMLEVLEKVEAYRKMDKRSLRKKIKSSPVSVVVGPEGRFYIVDGHHHVAAAWLAGVAKVNVKVTKDFSHARISNRDFWRYLKTHRCVHLFDQYGNGPHDPVYLPRDVRGLGDDPYRSLAWLVRESGGIAKSSKRFAEFEWANLFRTKKILHGTFARDFAVAKARALKVAKSRAARKLPGYIGT